MIWRRKEADEDAAIEAIRNRFATVLGLDNDKPGRDIAQDAGILPEDGDIKLGAELLSRSYDPMNPTVDGFTSPADLPGLEGNIRPTIAVSLDEQLKPAEVSAEPLLDKTDLQFSRNCSLQSGELLLVLDAEVSHLVQRSKELIERQSKLFEQTLVQVLNQAFSEAEASLQKSALRLEAYYAQIPEGTLIPGQSKVTSRDESEAAITRSNGFEQSLTKTAQVQQELATISTPISQEDLRQVYQE